MILWISKTMKNIKCVKFSEVYTVVIIICYFPGFSGVIKIYFNNQAEYII